MSELRQIIAVIERNLLYPPGQRPMGWAELVAYAGREKPGAAPPTCEVCSASDTQIKRPAAVCRPHYDIVNAGYETAQGELDRVNAALAAGQHELELLRARQAAIEEVKKTAIVTEAVHATDAERDARDAAGHD